MERPNPFLAMESDANCPPELKSELVAEIDLIRNVIAVVDLYIGDFFSSVLVLADPPIFHSDSPTTQL